VQKAVPVVAETFSARALAVSGTLSKQLIGPIEDALNLLACVGGIAGSARRRVEKIEFRDALVAIDERRQQSETRGELPWVNVKMEAGTKS
jgi:hypothetical protein